MGHALAEKEHDVAPSVDRYDYCNPSSALVSSA